MTSAPRATLSALDGTLMIVGIVIGIGIFKTPQMVAMNVGSEAQFVAIWVAGGLITLIGALVYAELAAAYPSAGGEYHFLTRALGQPVGLLFAWARTTVIQTGAIAAVAFVLGDYAQQLYSLGGSGAAIYAAAALILLTTINLAGTYQSKTVQNLFSVFLIAAMLGIIVIGLAHGGNTAAPASAGGETGAIGLAMVFILLTYGGWNEAAYISADVRNVRRDMWRILLFGTAIITTIYVLINLAYLHVLGLQGLRDSDALAAELMNRALGPVGAAVLSATICCAALSTMNASIFTGARLYYALGEDLSLNRLALWSRRGNNPRYAILAQSCVAMMLVMFGALSRDGFKAMVEYTAPVFWFFLLLVGVSFFVLRHRDARTPRPFRVPLYPLTPLIFCATCAYLLYSSVAYTGTGGLIGVAVLLLGLPVLGLARMRGKKAMAAAE